MAGELIGAFGRVVSCSSDKVSIECQNKDLKGTIVWELPDHVEKRFVEGGRVVVADGRHKGHEGTVLKVSGSTVCILTSNNHEIEALRRNVEKVSKGAVLQENPFHFAANNVIKTVKGDVGIVLDSSKSCLKILNLNNEICTISNLECGATLNTRGITAKNKFN
jgi:ribosomal protein L24